MPDAATTTGAPVGAVRLSSVEPHSDRSADLADGASAMKREDGVDGAAGPRCQNMLGVDERPNQRFGEMPLLDEAVGDGSEIGRRPAT